MNKKLIISSVIVLVLIAGAVYFFNNLNTPNNTENPTKISLVLQWLPEAIHSGIYVAQERGYFAEEGLDVDIHTPADGTTVLQTVAQGRDNFGINYQPDILLARSEGSPVVSIAALAHHPLYALMTLKKSGFTRPRDLAGKRIGHTGLPFERLLLDTVLRNDGVTKGTEGVQFIDVGYNALAGLLSGQLDGISVYYTNQPIIAENQGYQSSIMKVVDYGVPDYYELLIVTNEEMIKDHPDTVEKFLRAISKGYNEAAANPQEAIQLMKQAVPELDTDVASKEILLEKPLWFGENGMFGWQDEARWTSFAQWMKDGGLLTKPVDARKAFTNSFVESLR